jgi:hypothetical protein
LVAVAAWTDRLWAAKVEFGLQPGGCNWRKTDVGPNALSGYLRSQFRPVFQAQMLNYRGPGKWDQSLLNGRPA